MKHARKCLMYNIHLAFSVRLDNTASVKQYSNIKVPVTDLSQSCTRCIRICTHRASFQKYLTYNRNLKGLKSTFSMLTITFLDLAFFQENAPGLFFRIIIYMYAGRPRNFQYRVVNSSTVKLNFYSCDLSLFFRQ